MSGNTRQVLKCRRHRIVYSFQQRSTRHGEIVQPRPKRRNCVAGFLPPPALFLSVKHGDDDDDDDEDDDDYNLPSKMFFSIKQSVSILFSFTMLLLFMFGTFAFFIISLDLFCSNIAGPSLIEINEKLWVQEWKKQVEGLMQNIWKTPNSRVEKNCRGPTSSYILP